MSCCCDQLVAEARGQFGNPEEGEPTALEAVTRKLAKTQEVEKTYVLVRVVVNCRV
jgi:hypothetical protein